MVQWIGIAVVLCGIAIATWWVWQTWFASASVGQTVVGKYITAALESAQLTSTLGYVELLSHVDAIEASPEATGACNIIADVLWTAAKEAWKTAQTTGSTTLISTAVPPTLTKATLPDGSFVYVVAPGTGAIV